MNEWGKMKWKQKELLYFFAFESYVIKGYDINMSLENGIVSYNQRHHLFTFSHVFLKFEMELKGYTAIHTCVI